jgi:hypothetical protein
MCRPSSSDACSPLTLAACVRASTRTPLGANGAGPTPAQPACLDTFALRTLCHDPVAQQALVSALTPTPARHTRRHSVRLRSGERLVLRFELACERTVRAAYKALPSEEVWVLRAVTGEWFGVLADAPTPVMGPEAVLARVLQVLRDGDAAAAAAFAAPRSGSGSGAAEGSGEPWLQGALASPVFGPLLGHLDAQVISCRHVGPHKAAALVKVLPPPRPHKVGGTASSLFVWTLTRQPCSAAGAPCWLIAAVHAVPVAFVNAWPRSA